MLTISDIVEQAYQTAKSKGWYDPTPSIPERLCLIHSEVTEALEDYRAQHEVAPLGISLRDVYYQGEDDIQFSRSSFKTNENGQDVEVLNKPVGFPSELADIVIRVCDLAGFLGIDLETAIKDKMAYNATRPHRHGGKAC